MHRHQDSSCCWAIGHCSSFVDILVSVFLSVYSVFPERGDSLEAVTNNLYYCDYVTYVIIAPSIPLCFHAVYPCESSVLFFIRCETRVLHVAACQVHERIDLKDCYYYYRYTV